MSSNSVTALMGEKSEKVIKTRDRMRAKGKPKAVKIPVQTKLIAERSVESTPGVNVLGYIEGIDPQLKDEVVVVSAHYDHLGKRGEDIFHGADDNASGTSGVIAIAGAFAEAKRQGAGPRRSVLCLLVTGERKDSWVLNTIRVPCFSAGEYGRDVNIDMIGRWMTNMRSYYTYVSVLIVSTQHCTKS
jgi:Zn-dependent M28 family amino/carboxypeptidase